MLIRAGFGLILLLQYYGRDDKALVVESRCSPLRVKNKSEVRRDNSADKWQEWLVSRARTMFYFGTVQEGQKTSRVT